MQDVCQGKSNLSAEAKINSTEENVGIRLKKKRVKLSTSTRNSSLPSHCSGKKGRFHISWRFTEREEISDRKRKGKTPGQGHIHTGNQDMGADTVGDEKRKMCQVCGMKIPESVDKKENNKTNK